MQILIRKIEQVLLSMLLEKIVSRFFKLGLNLIDFAKFCKIMDINGPHSFFKFCVDISKSLEKFT